MTDRGTSPWSSSARTPSMSRLGQVTTAAVSSCAAAGSPVRCPAHWASSWSSAARTSAAAICGLSSNRQAAPQVASSDPAGAVQCSQVPVPASGPPRRAGTASRVPHPATCGGSGSSGSSCAQRRVTSLVTAPAAVPAAVGISTPTIPGQHQPATPGYRQATLGCILIWPPSAAQGR